MKIIPKQLSGKDRKTKILGLLWLLAFHKTLQRREIELASRTDFEETTIPNLCQGVQNLTLTDVQPAGTQLILLAYLMHGVTIAYQQKCEKLEKRSKKLEKDLKSLA